MEKRKRGIWVSQLKPWRKPKQKYTKKDKRWAPTGMRDSTRTKMLAIMNAMVYGVKESTIDPNYKPYTPMPMKQAAKEFGISQFAFLSTVNNYDEMKERYEHTKTLKREAVKNLAENNLEKALQWMMDMEWKDVARLSLDYMKSTDKAFNPKLEIEQNVKRLNLDVSDEELKLRIQELMNN